jgi:hypothetical protein
MSLNNYQTLQKQSTLDAEALGCILPKMQAAQLNCHAEKQTVDQVIVAITELKPTAGWYMQADKVVIAAQVPPRDRFIEGEWSNGEQSIKAKLLHGDQYLLTIMTPVNGGAKQHAYNTQSIHLRNMMKNDQSNLVVYRLWWQLVAARWTPLAQQFIGYDWDQSAAEPKVKEQAK